MGIVNLIFLFGQLAVTAAGTYAGLDPNLVKLVQGLLSSVLPSVQAISTGQSKITDAAALIGTMQMVVQTLKDSGKLDQATANNLATISDGLAGAVSNYIKSLNGIDLTLLGPEAPIQ